MHGLNDSFTIDNEAELGTFDAPLTRLTPQTPFRSDSAFLGDF